MRGLLVGVGLLLAGCRPAASDRPELRTPEERFSYGIGAQFGGDLRKSGHELDREALVRGLQDGLTGEIALSDEELAAALEQGVEQRLARQQARREERAQAAREEGRAFLAQNGARPGVVTLPSGVQYEVLREGDGPTPDIESFVTCHSRGTLLDGSVFDDTATLGRPRTFAVTSVVDGLEEALQKMRPGAHWKIYVPSELGYGAAGAREKVPPHSTLIFEVELVSVGARPGS